jgi:hypothetical protein
MSVVRLRSYTASAIATPVSEELFKEDHPRRIDRVISFFGEDAGGADDLCGERALDHFGDGWPR